MLRISAARKIIIYDVAAYETHYALLLKRAHRRKSLTSPLVIFQRLAITYMNISARGNEPALGGEKPFPVMAEDAHDNASTITLLFLIEGFTLYQPPHQCIDLFSKRAKYRILITSIYH